jgi:hypothetical protein
VLSLIHTLHNSLQHALNLLSLLFFHSRCLVTAPNAVDSSASVFHGSCPRWLEPTSQLTCKSKSHYDRQSVGQSVLVSSPIWGPRPDFCYCQTFAVLSMWGALSDKRTGPHHWKFSKVDTGPQFAHGFQPSVCLRLYNKIVQATSRGHTKS